MTILRTLIFTAFLIALLAAPARLVAQTLPEPLAENVSDFAQALNATEEGRISRILAETEEKTGVEIVFVTISGLDLLDAENMRLEDLGTALFNDWGIGDRKRNDGILLLIDTEAREARITLGSGYPDVYDERAARVLSTALLPLLREGRMASALEAAIVSIRDQLVAPFVAGTPVGATDGFEEPNSGLPLRIGLAFAGIAGFLGVSFWRRARARKMCPKCRALTLKRETEIILSATKFQDGLGLEHRTCSSCGYVDRLSFTIKAASRESRRTRDDRPANPAQTPDQGEPRGAGGGKTDGGGAGGKW